MTHHPIKTLPDGTRVYSNGSTYKPLSDEERTYRRRKPDTPGAVLYNRDWVVPLLLLDDGLRAMPETRPDTDAYDHRAGCRCHVCGRPESAYWKDLRDRGVRYAWDRPGRLGPDQTWGRPPDAGTAAG